MKDEKKEYWCHCETCGCKFLGLKYGIKCDECISGSPVQRYDVVGVIDYEGDRTPVHSEKSDVGKWVKYANVKHVFSRLERVEKKCEKIDNLLKEFTNKMDDVDLQKEDWKDKTAEVADWLYSELKDNELNKRGEKSMLESKVIQIQSCDVNGVHVITVLCEDGSIFNSYDSNDWVMLEEKFTSEKKQSTQIDDDMCPECRDHDNNYYCSCCGLNY